MVRAQISTSCECEHLRLKTLRVIALNKELIPFYNKSIFETSISEMDQICFRSGDEEDEVNGAFGGQKLDAAGRSES